MPERKKKTRTFLWVNKDEASLSLSSSDHRESQRIFSFVQRQRSDTNAEKKGRHLPRLNLAFSCRHRALSISSPDPNHLARPQQSPSTSWEGNDDAHAQPQQPPTGRSSIPRQVNDWLKRRRCNEDSVPRYNYLPGSGIDPFSATPLPINRHVQALIRYYWIFAVTGAHNDKTEILPPHLQPVHRYAAVRDSALRGAMQSKLLFAGLMVIMAARMVHISRIPMMNTPPPEYYLELTLQEIRERMLECQDQGTPMDSGLIRSIQCLALAEWICQRYDAATIHVQAAKKLFPLANFGHPSDAFAREGIVNIDNLICIETGRLPEFPVMYDPGPLEMSRMALIRDEVGALAVGQVNQATHPHSPVQDATRPTSAFVPHQVDILADASTTLACTLGSGFERGLAADAVHPLLAPVLRDILDVLTVAKSVWRTPNTTEQDADWMCKRARALVHRLLLLRANPFFSEQTISARKAKVLRIALLLVLIRCTNRVAFRSARPNMRRLQHALHGIDQDWCTNKTISWGTEAEMTGSSCHLQPESPASTSLWDSASSSSSPGPLNAPFGRPLRNPQPKQYDQNALLLWALMTGHFNAQGEPEESWFLERAVYVAETHLGIYDYDGLDDFMSQYFYSKTRQQHSLTIVALHLS